MVKITTSHKFTFNFPLSLPESVGKTPSGNRVFIAVNGGTVTGSGVEATGIHGGDWAIAGDDGWGKLDVRSHAKTKEGELIYITYGGHLEMTPAVMKALGQAPDAVSTQFGEHGHMVSVSMESSAPRLAWLNRTVFVGRGRLEVTKEGTSAIYEVFEAN